MASGRQIAGIGVRLDETLVSSAVADNTDPFPTEQIQELTFTGTPKSITTEQYTGTVGGAPATGDQARLVLNGVVYAAEKSVANTVGDMATELTNASSLGSRDKWVFTFTGGPAVGGEHAILDIGVNTYNYTCGAGDSNTVIAAGVAALAAADPIYGVTAAFGKLILSALARGVQSSSVTVTGSIAHTDVHTVTGVAGQALWTVSNIGAAVTINHAAPGNVGTDTCASAVTGGTTFALTTAQVGYAADQVIAFDGISQSWSHTVTVGQTKTDCANALKLLINGSGGYVASIVGDVVSVTRTDYAAFAFADQSVTPNPTSTIAITPVTTQALNPPLAATSGAFVGQSRNATGSIEAFLNAGTSYNLDVWGYDDSLGVWVHDLTFGTKTVVASGSYTVQMNGSRMFAQVSTFVGGASATVKLTTAG